MDLPDPGKPKLLNYAALGFLVVSLIAVAVVASDPLKKQLVKIFAAINEPPGTNYSPIPPKTPTPTPLKSRTPTATPRTPTPTPRTCTNSGTTRCSGSNVEVCSGGIWRSANCTYGCSNSRCNPSPAPARTRTPTPFRTKTPTPIATATLITAANLNLTQQRSPLPSRLPTATPRPVGGYGSNTSLIINPDASPNRPGFDCKSNPGVCPPGVEVSGFYRAPNGQFYPINQNSGGPTSNDLQYIQKNIEKANATPVPPPNISLNQALNLPSGNPFAGSLNIVFPPSATPRIVVNQNNTTSQANTSQGTNQNQPQSPTSQTNQPPATIPANIALNDLFGGTGNTQTGNLFSSGQYQNLENQINNALGPLSAPVKRDPTPKPPTPPKTEAGSLALTDLFQTADGTSLFGANQELNSQLTLLMQYRAAVYEAEQRQREAIAAAEAASRAVVASSYTCKSGYILQQNEFGNNYCVEDPANLNKNEWNVRCDDKGCLKCTTGFFSVCHRLETIEAFAPAVPPASASKKQLGATCSSAGECGSGSCASSWIESNGSRTFSTRGNVCTHSASSQTAFVAAAAQRETDTVRFTAAGLAIPTAIHAVPSIATNAFTTYGQVLTGTLPAAGQAALNVASNLIPAATVGYLTYGAGDCSFGYAGGNACRTAGELAITGYTTDPTGFAMMFRQVGQIPSLTRNTVSAFRNLNNARNAANEAVPALASSNSDEVAEIILPNGQILNYDEVMVAQGKPTWAQQNQTVSNAINNSIPALNSGINSTANTSLQVVGGGGSQLINVTAGQAQTLGPSALSLLPSQTALTLVGANATANALTGSGLNILTQNQIQNVTNSIINKPPTITLPSQTASGIIPSTPGTITVPSSSTNLTYVPPTFSLPANQFPSVSQTGVIPYTPPQTAIVPNPPQQLPVVQLPTNTGNVLTNVSNGITNTINNTTTAITNTVEGAIQNVQNTIPLFGNQNVAVILPPANPGQNIQIPTANQNTPDIPGPTNPIPETDVAPVRVRRPQEVRQLPPPPSTTSESNQRIEQIMDYTDTYLTERLNEGSALGCRAGVCDLSSSYVAVASYETGFVPQIFGIEELNAIRGIPPQNSVGHYMTVVKNPVTGDAYLTDRTFNQFVDPDTLMIRSYQKGKEFVVGPLSQHPVAQELLDKGYIKLTDENLNAYLDLTTNLTPQKPIVVSQLAEAKPYIEKPLTQRELDEWAPELKNLAANTGVSNQGLAIIDKVEEVVTGISKTLGLIPDISTTIAKVEKISSIVDQTLTTNFPNGQNAFGCRQEFCVHASAFTQSLGRAEGLNAERYAIEDLNRARGVTSGSFEHDITIISDGQNSFLLDNTFVQFVDPVTGRITQNINGVTIQSGAHASHPIVQQLKDKGYILLTDNTLNEYLEILSSGAILPKTNLAIVNSVKPKTSLIYTLDEITGYEYEGVFEIFRIMERGKPGTIQVYDPVSDSLISLTEMERRTKTVTEIVPAPQAELTLPQKISKSIKDTAEKAIQTVKNIFEPQPLPEGVAVRRYAQEIPSLELKETGKKPWLTTLKEKLIGPRQEITLSNIFKPRQAPLSRYATPQELDSNFRMTNDMKAQTGANSDYSPIKIVNVETDEFTGILGLELPGGPSGYQRTFTGTNVDTSTYAPLFPGQIGPASQSKNILPIVDGINIKSPNAAKMLQAFEDSAAKIGLDTIVAVKVTDLDAYSFFASRGYNPPATWVPDGPYPRPPYMVKNVDPKKFTPVSMKGQLGNLGEVDETLDVAASILVQDTVESIYTPRPGETMQDVMDRINKAMAGTELRGAVNPNAAAASKPKGDIVGLWLTDVKKPFEDLGNLVRDAAGNSVEIIDEAGMEALGWFTPKQLNRSVNLLPEPKVTQASFTKKPLDTGFVKGSNYYNTAEYDQVIIKPGDSIASYRGNQKAPTAVGIPHDGQLVLLNHPGEGIVSGTARVYYRINHTDYSPQPMQKMPAEGITINTHDTVEIWHFSSTGYSYKLGTVTTPQTMGISISRDPDQIFINMGADFTTSGVSTVLESTGQITVSGLIDYLPFPETIPLSDDPLKALGKHIENSLLPFDPLANMIIKHYDTSVGIVNAYKNGAEYFGKPKEILPPASAPDLGIDTQTYQSVTGGLPAISQKSTSPIVRGLNNIVDALEWFDKKVIGGIFSRNLPPGGPTNLNQSTTVGSSLKATGKQNEIFVISPDKKPGERFVEQLTRNGFLPTNYDTAITPRVVDGVLNLGPTSPLAQDIADAMTWGYKCGFTLQAISCNTGQLPEVIDAVWPLLPQEVRENVTLITTFDAIKNAYSGKPLPLVIGTTPTANSLARSRELPTLVSEGLPAIQEKVQRLIWLEKRAQGSVLPTAPIEVQKLSVESAQNVAEGLADQIADDLNRFGYHEVVVACTDITVLCNRNYFGVKFKDPAEFIKPKTQTNSFDKFLEKISQPKMPPAGGGGGINIYRSVAGSSLPIAVNNSGSPIIKGLNNVVDALQWFDTNVIQRIFSTDLPIPPSQPMLDLVKTVDEAINIKVGPRRVACRLNQCGEASALTFHQGNVNQGLKVESYNAYDLNTARGVADDLTPSHLFSIATDETGQKFIVDLSISQYIDETTTDPVILELFNNGLIPLTKKNLNTYLDFLSSGPKAKSVELSILDTVPPRPTTVTTSQNELLDTVNKSLKPAPVNQEGGIITNQSTTVGPGNLQSIAPEIKSSITKDVTGIDRNYLNIYGDNAAVSEAVLAMTQAAEAKNIKVITIQIPQAGIQSQEEFFDLMAKGFEPYYVIQRESQLPANMNLGMELEKYSGDEQFLIIFKDSHNLQKNLEIGEDVLLSIRGFYQERYSNPVMRKYQIAFSGQADIRNVRPELSRRSPYNIGENYDLSPGKPTGGAIESVTPPTPPSLWDKAKKLFSGGGSETRKFQSVVDFPTLKEVPADTSIAKRLQGILDNIFQKPPAVSITPAQITEQMTDAAHLTPANVPVISVHETAPTSVNALPKSAFFDQLAEPAIPGWTGDVDQALSSTIASKGYQNMIKNIPTDQIPLQIKSMAAPSAGRSDFLVLETPLIDKAGNVFPVIQRKGVGTVRQVLVPSDELKLFGRPLLMDQLKNPEIGNTRLLGHELDVKISTLWAQNGLRVREPYKAYELKTVFDGGEATDLTLREDYEANPLIISTFATRDPFTFEDFNWLEKSTKGNPQALKDLVNATLKDRAYFLQFEPDPKAIALSRALAQNPGENAYTWLDYITDGYGSQVGIKTQKGLLSGESHRQNHGVIVEFKDLGDNVRFRSLARYKSNPVPFSEITDPEYKEALIEEVVETMSTLLDANSVLNKAFGFDQTHNVSNVVTRFMNGMKSVDEATYIAVTDQLLAQNKLMIKSYQGDLYGIKMESGTADVVFSLDVWVDQIVTTISNLRRLDNLPLPQPLKNSAVSRLSESQLAKPASQPPYSIFHHQDITTVAEEMVRQNGGAAQMITDLLPRVAKTVQTAGLTSFHDMRLTLDKILSQMVQQNPKAMALANNPDIIPYLIDMDTSNEISRLINSDWFIVKNGPFLTGKTNTLFTPSGSVKIDPATGKPEMVIYQSAVDFPTLTQKPGIPLTQRVNNFVESYVRSADGAWLPAIRKAMTPNPFKNMDLNTYPTTTNLSTQRSHQLRRVIDFKYNIVKEQRLVETEKGLHNLGNYWVEGSTPDYVIGGKSAMSVVDIKAKGTGGQPEVLDIGAARGGFVANVKSKYPNARVVAVSAHDYTAGQGIPGIEYKIANAEYIGDIYTENSFDVIASHVTFTHLMDPLGTVSQAYKLLKPNGILMIDYFDTPGMTPDLLNLKNFLQAKGYKVEMGIVTRELKGKTVVTGFNGLIIEKGPAQLELPVKYKDPQTYISYEYTGPRAATEPEMVTYQSVVDFPSLTEAGKPGPVEKVIGTLFPSLSTPQKPVNPVLHTTRPASIQTQIDAKYLRESTRELIPGKLGPVHPEYGAEGRLATDYKFGDVSAIETINQTAIAKSEPVSVLEVGAGAGSFSKVVKTRHPNSQVSAISAHDYTKGKGIPGIDYKIANAENVSSLYPNESFDVIVSGMTMMHLVDPLGTVTQMYDLLKPGGTLMVDYMFTNGLSMEVLDDMKLVLSSKGYNVDIGFTNNYKGFEVEYLVIKKVPGSPSRLELPISYEGMGLNGYARYSYTDPGTPPLTNRYMSVVDTGIQFSGYSPTVNEPVVRVLNSLVNAFEWVDTEIIQRIFSGNLTKPVAQIPATLSVPRDEVYGWQVKTNPNPDSPIVSTKTSPEMIDAYIAKLPTPERKAAESLLAQSVMDQHITHEQFLDTLNTKTVPSLNAAIGKDKFVVITDQDSSNQWVFELSLKNLDHLPENVFDQLQDTRVLIEYLAKNPDIKHVAIFDDAGYTGNQTKNTLAMIDGLLADNGLTAVQLHVAIPYLTQNAKNTLAGYAEVTEHQIIPMVEELFTAEQIEILDKGGVFVEFGQSTVTFDHKVGDKRSTPFLDQRVVSKGGYIPDPVSPYSNNTSPLTLNKYQSTAGFMPILAKPKIETPASQALKSFLDLSEATDPIPGEVTFRLYPNHPLNPNPQASQNARNYVMRKTSLSSIAIDPTTGEEIDSYQILLDKIKTLIEVDNLTPFEAVNQTLLQAKPVDYFALNTKITEFMTQKQLPFIDAYKLAIENTINPAHRELLQKSVADVMQQKNLSETAAVMEVINNLRPTAELDNVSVAFKNKDSITARVLCTRRIDCLETPVLQEMLLADLGVTEPYSIIIGVGGSKGNSDLPYTHGALLYGDQVVGFNLDPRPISVFQRFANMRRWGHFGLEKSLPQPVVNLANITTDALTPSHQLPVPTLAERIDEAYYALSGDRSLPPAVKKITDFIGNWINNNIVSPEGTLFPGLTTDSSSSGMVTYQSVTDFPTLTEIPTDKSISKRLENILNRVFNRTPAVPADLTPITTATVSVSPTTTAQLHFTRPPEVNNEIAMKYIKLNKTPLVQKEIVGLGNPKYSTEGRRSDYTIGGKSAIELVDETAAKTGGEFAVLEVGAGEGEFVKNVKSRHPNAKVSAITAQDYNEGRGISGVDYRIANAETLYKEYPPESFNAIVSHFTLIHLADPLGAITQMYTLLKPGGTLLVDHFFTSGINTETMQDIYYFLGTQGYDIKMGIEALNASPNSSAFVKYVSITKGAPTLELPVGYNGTTFDGSAKYKYTGPVTPPSDVRVYQSAVDFPQLIPLSSKPKSMSPAGWFQKNIVNGSIGDALFGKPTVKFIGALSESAQALYDLRNPIKSTVFTGNIVIKDSEPTIDKIIQLAELKLTPAIGPNLAGCRVNRCPLASSAVNLIAIANGWEAKIINNAGLLLRNKLNSYYPGGASQNGSILTDPVTQKRYIVDLSLNQFADSIPASNTTGQTILKNGFIELTEDTLNEYIHATFEFPSPNLPRLKLTSIDVLDKITFHSGEDLNVLLKPDALSAKAASGIAANQTIAVKNSSLPQITNSEFYVNPTEAGDVLAYFEKNYNPVSGQFTTEISNGSTSVSFAYNGKKYVVKTVSAIAADALSFRQETLGEALPDLLIPTTFRATNAGKIVAIQNVLEFQPYETASVEEKHRFINKMKDKALIIVNPRDEAVLTDAGIKIINVEGLRNLRDAMQSVALDPEIANYYSRWFSAEEALTYGKAIGAKPITPTPISVEDVPGNPITKFINTYIRSESGVWFPTIGTSAPEVTPGMQRFESTTDFPRLNTDPNIQKVHEIKTSTAHVFLDYKSMTVARRVLPANQIDPGTLDFHFGGNFQEYLNQEFIRPALYFQKFGGKNGVPKIIKIYPDYSYDVELMPGVPLLSYEGEITPKDFEAGIAKLKLQFEASKIPHGDIKPDNILVQKLPGGKIEFNFIDHRGDPQRSFNQDTSGFSASINEFRNWREYVASKRPPETGITKIVKDVVDAGKKMIDGVSSLLIVGGGPPPYPVDELSVGGKAAEPSVVATYNPRGNSLVDGMQVQKLSDGTVQVKTNLDLSYLGNSFITIKPGDRIPGIAGSAVIADSKGNLYYFDDSAFNTGTITRLTGNSTPPNFLDTTISKVTDNWAYKRALDKVISGKIPAPKDFPQTAVLLINEGHNPKNLDFKVLAKFTGDYWSTRPQLDISGQDPDFGNLPSDISLKRLDPDTGVPFDSTKDYTQITGNTAAETTDIRPPKNPIVKKVQEIVQNIKDVLSGGAMGGPPPYPVEDSNITDVIQKVDSALIKAGQPKGVGCRDSLCETASGFIKIDAEARGLTAKNYRVSQFNVIRHGQPGKSLPHHFSLITDSDGKIYIVDLTIGQFKEIDFADPIAAALLKDGYIPYTLENFNHYLDLFTTEKLSPLPEEALGWVKSNTPYLSVTQKDTYVKNGEILLTTAQPDTGLDIVNPELKKYGEAVLKTTEDLYPAQTRDSSFRDCVISGDPYMAFEYGALCGLSGDRAVAQALTEQFGTEISKATALHPLGGDHVYLVVRETDTVIDPIAGLFIPPFNRVGYKEYFNGNMFIGPRSVLKQISENGVINSTYFENSELAFQTIWGDESIYNNRPTLEDQRKLEKMEAAQSAVLAPQNQPEPIGQLRIAMPFAPSGQITQPLSIKIITNGIQNILDNLPIPVTLPKNPTQVKILADDINLRHYGGNIRGFYYALDKKLIVDKSAAHAELARKYNLTDLAEDPVAQIINEPNYILFDFNYGIRINEFGPEMAQAFLDYNARPSLIIRLKGNYGNLGEGVYEANLKEIAKGLRPEIFIPNGSQNNSSGGGAGTNSWWGFLRKYLPAIAPVGFAADIVNVPSDRKCDELQSNISKVICKVVNFIIVSPDSVGVSSEASLTPGKIGGRKITEPTPTPWSTPLPPDSPALANNASDHKLSLSPESQNLLDTLSTQTVKDHLDLTFVSKDGKRVKISFPYSGRPTELVDIKKAIELIENLGGISRYLPNLEIVRVELNDKDYISDVKSDDQINGRLNVRVSLHTDTNLVEAIASTLLYGPYGTGGVSKLQVSYYHNFYLGKMGTPGNYTLYENRPADTAITSSNENLIADLTAYLSNPDSLKLSNPAKFAYLEAVFKGYDPMHIQLANATSTTLNSGSVIRNYDMELAAMDKKFQSMTINNIPLAVVQNNSDYLSAAQTASLTYNVPVGIIVGVMENETGAVENRNTIPQDENLPTGIMQVAPRSGVCTVEEARSSYTNIQCGTRLLRLIYDDPTLGNGNWRDTIALYNVGNWEDLLTGIISGSEKEIKRGGYTYADNVLIDAGINPDEAKIK